MKTRSALLVSALFAAGVIGLNTGVVHADTADASATATATQAVTDNQSQNVNANSTTSSITVTDANQTATSTNDSNSTNNATNTNQNKQVIAPAPTRKVVEDKFVGRISQKQGWKVNLWSLDDSSNLSWTGKRLDNGSRWKVFSYTDLTDKNMRLYNLGGNQWVDANYIVRDADTAASATQGMTPLPKNSFVVVSYLPHYGVALWKENGNRVVSTGRTLANGTAWSAFGKKNINSKLYYNLGGNQWVDSAWVIEGASTGKYAVLKNNANSTEYYTSQYNPVFAPWGCASAALSMLMKYDGNWKNVPGSTDAAKIKYLQDHLPRNKALGGQDGNPYTGAGFTRVITSRALMNYAHHFDNKIKDVSGISLGNIAKLVEAGHPVLYYGWSSYNGNGGGKDPYGRNHCKVIFGYNPANNKFLVHDPLYMYKHFYAGGGGSREGIHNGYDLGPVAWVSYSTIAREFAYRGGNNALTIQ